MMEQYDDSIEFVKALAEGMYADPSYLPSEGEISGAVVIANMHLGSRTGQISTIIQAEKAYVDLITSQTPSIAELPESRIERSMIDKPTIQGEIERFYWFGSITMHALCVKVGGVEIIAPERRLHTNAFVDVRDIIEHHAA
ncbi:MAG: hypothetical protein JWO54_744 [Candidatus Saccharibacteria bacterium]|nr:hypothetical protein [Candidatus Saccharibacteria bacterium]